MALAPQLLNVILNIGKGYAEYAFSISYSRTSGLGPAKPEAGLKHAAGQMGEDPPLTGRKLERLCWG